LRASRTTALGSGDLAATDPSGFALPLHAALRGSLFTATAHHDVHPTRRVRVVVILDGSANACAMTDTPAIAALAASAVAYNNTQTLVIGLPGAADAEVDAISAAGGTVGVDLTPGADAATILEALLGAVQSCEVPLGDFDPELAVVHDGDTLVPRVDDQSMCAGPGWYLDDPTVVLCPESCDLAFGAPGQLVLSEPCGP
jgi:hypothetical protein